MWSFSPGFPEEQAFAPILGDVIPSKQNRDFIVGIFGPDSE
jgi:hypothetical protein